MKILNICQKDYAGVGIKLTEAVNAHTKHKARHLCMEAHHFQYPMDICTRSMDEMRHWIKWADVVNCHVYQRPLSYAGMRPKKLIMTQHGSYFRSKTEKAKGQNKKWNARRVLGTTPDLVKYGATWLPTAIPVARYERMRRSHGGKPIVCQTPSNPAKKNTAEIKSVLGERKDIIRLVLAHHMTHDEVLREKAVADIFIDRFRLGLGVSGLEAAAMGIPVIACSSVEDEKYILDEIGYLPYYKASLKTLNDAIDKLLNYPTLYKEYAERGKKYVLDFHDYPVVAKRYAAICEEVLCG